MARYTRARSRRCATPSTWSTSSARAPSCARRDARSYSGTLPVPRGAQPVVQRRAGREALPLLRLPGGAATRSSSCRRSRASASATRSSYLADRYGVAARGRRGGSRGGRAARARASGCSSCWSARRRSTCATCGTPTRRAMRASTCSGAGWRRATLREFRVGYAPSAWDKVLLASRSGGVLQPRDLRRRARVARQRRADLRPLPRADHVPAVRPRGRVLGFGARAMGADAGPKYLNTPENDIFHKGRQLFGADHRAGARRRAAGAVIVGRGLHRRHRAAPGGPAQLASGSWGRR